MERNLVSIIMPAYNSERYISESIESVMVQTYLYWELIIVDDGSTDKTATIAKRYSEKDLRIKYIYQANGKQGKARNNGIKNSNGEFIAFLDSDDLWVPQKLEIQIETMHKYQVDLVCSEGLIFQNTINCIQGNLNAFRGFYHPEQLIDQLLKENRIPILSVLASKEKILQAGAFDETPIVQNIEDYHLWIKMVAEDCLLYGLTENLVYYRRHETQVTNSDPLFYQRIFWMFDSVTNTYPVLAHKFHTAEKKWWIECFLKEVSSKKEGITLIQDSRQIPSVKNITNILRFILLTSGVSASKFFLKVVNRSIAL